MSSKIRKHIVFGNFGHKSECWAGLNAGDEILCIKSMGGVDDIGASGLTFEYTMFEKGEKYKVNHVTDFNMREVAYVVDNTGCATWVDTEHFRPVNYEG